MFPAGCPACLFGASSLIIPEIFHCLSFAGKAAMPPDDTLSSLSSVFSRARPEADCFLPLPQFALLEVAGTDARAFLHAQLTSDVKALTATHAQFSAWCTAQGRMLANFILYVHPAPEGETLRLLLKAERLPEIRQRLQKYVLRARVTLAARDDLAHLGLCSARAAALLEAAGFALPPEDAMLGMRARDENTLIRLPDGRYLLTAPQASLNEGMVKRLAAQLPVADAPYWQWRDICAALPWIDNATAEAFVPQMLDFEKVGVSFRKGCYPGQEVIARAQYLGEVKRHLYRLAASRPLRAGEDLRAADDPECLIGKVIVTAPVPDAPERHVALAVLRDADIGRLADIQAERAACAHP
jgi:folate-binding protein YgfZ